MFCENCGNNIKSPDKFCENCGNPKVAMSLDETLAKAQNLDQKWWYRFAKVFYIALYILLPIYLLFLWDDVRDDERLTVMLVMFIVYIALARLIKIVFLYITLGRKPQWAREFRRLF